MCCRWKGAGAQAEANMCRGLVFHMKRGRWQVLHAKVIPDVIVGRTQHCDTKVGL